MAYHDLAAEAPSRRWLSRLYVIAWVVLAGLALTYLAALALRPDLVAAYLPTPAATKPQSNEGQRATARLLAEVQSLRQTVDAVQRDVVSVKSSVAAQEAAGKTLARRVGDLEERVAQPVPPTAALEKPAAPVAEAVPAVRGTTTDSASTEAPPPAQSAAQSKAAEVAAKRAAQRATAAAKAKEAREAAAAKAAETAAGRATAEAARPPTQMSAADAASALNVSLPASPKIINATPAQAQSQAKSSTIETASLPPLTPAGQGFTTTTVKEAAAPLTGGAPMAIRLSSGPSVDALRLSWSLLNERHRGTLGRLEPRYLAGANGDPNSYQLLAGPLSNADEAGKVCSELKTRGVPCRVGTFGGDAL